jgi:outer membrane receptor for ferrienterochelin and colicin
LEWIHTFSSKTALNLAGIYSSYTSSISSDQPEVNSFDLTSHLQYLSVKPTLNYQSGKHRMQAGGEAIHYAVDPGTMTPGSSLSSINPLYLNREQSYELSGFASDEIQFTNWLSLMMGARYSQFLNMGSANVYNYNSLVTRSIDSITDTTH